MNARLIFNKLMPDDVALLDFPLGATLHEWVEAEAPGYQSLERQPVSIWINGTEIPVAQWPQVRPLVTDDIAVVAEPAGNSVKKALKFINPYYYFQAAALSRYGKKALTPKLPSTPQLAPGGLVSRGVGSSIYDVNVQGNRPRLTGVIPEIAGRHRYYPDHISQPHRYYVDNEQYLDLLMCVGRGHYDLPGSRILIANSSMTRLAGDVTWQLFNPGQDVTTHPAYRNWYTSPEVDSFEIEGVEVKSIQVAEGISEIVVGNDGTGNYLVIRGVTGATDPGWAIGSRIEISEASASSTIFEGVVEIIDSGDDVDDEPLPDVIRGPYDWTGLTVGQVIQLSAGGVDDGTYTVATVSGRDLTLIKAGEPATGLTASGSVLIRLFRSDTVDGLYEVVGRAVEVAYLARVGEPGWTGFGEEQIYERANIDLVYGARPSNEYGPYCVCPPGEKVTKIELDFLRRGGWGYYDDAGGFFPLTVDVEFHWRDADAAGAWTVIPHAFTGKSVDELGDTISLTLPTACRAELKIVRVTGRFGKSSFVDSLTWTGLKSELPAKTSYAGETVLALTIKSSNALAASSENKLSVEPIRKLPVLLDEGVWSVALTATRDISAFMRYALHSDGYSDQEIDQAELWRLHQLWLTRGDTLDGVFDSETTLFDALKLILAPGFAEPTMTYSTWRPVRDEAITADDIEQQFGPHVQRIDSFQMDDALQVENATDGVDVEYMDPVTWKPATVQCRLPGDAGAKVLRINAFGITDKKRAWRLGMRERRKALYRRRTMRFDTEMAGLNVSYLSPISCADAEPGFNFYGAVVGWDAATLTLTLSSPVVFAAGASNVIALRRPDGSQYGPVAITAVGDPAPADLVFDPDTVPSTDPAYLQVRLATVPDFDLVLDGTTNGDATHFLAGEATTWCYTALVTNARPQGTSKVSIDAVAYDSRVYEDDDNAPPI